ncbi:MAG: HAMP domain-containing protein [Parafilimonas terrae]|nr:HAMP domain-containing protein [Parafilimonas terrae]
MSFLNRVKIFPKIVTVVTTIGVIVGGCVWYAQSRMTHIDDVYSQFIKREARAASTARRVNRLIFEMNYWVYRIIAETEEGQMKAADAGFLATLPVMQKALTDLREQAPSFGERVEGQSARVNRFVQDASEVRRLGTSNQNAEAIALVHTAIDPTFSEMVQEGNKLGEEISAYMEKGSDELTDQTNNTRYSLMGISLLGMLAGLVLATVIVIGGITRPLSNLVSVLQRMAHGEIDAQIKEVAREDEIGAVGKAVEGIKAMVAQKAAEQAELKRIADEAAAT